MKYLIVLFPCQLLLLNAEYIFDHPCPNRPVMQNFNINKIAGKWYSVMQYEDAYTSSFFCDYTNYYVIDNSSVKVTFCELHNKAYSCLTGIISIMNPTRSILEGSALYAFIDNPKKIIDEFKYLSVDYDDYAVVYNCKNIDGNKSVQNVWVVSRTPNLSDNGKSKVDVILDEHFDRSKIKSVEQNPDICDEQNFSK
ncbi:unnamed protein product [Chironomus riparius]|uniref:Lipocalin/cytosolic fatty-acid binding domain-containing protein n=1 Tax=Chironomus riparius TaxID=315576 RepID=A0A9N9RST3_9DIPT|nr:unnamed protein product [Chironomus riparius]